MNRTEFLKGLKDALELEANLKEDTKIKELDEWDSMNALMLIAYVSDNFNVDINAEDLKSITTVSSLIDRIGIEKFN